MLRTGTLTLQQAVNIIAVAIGITKDEARELIGETAETRANDEHETNVTIWVKRLDKRRRKW